MPMHWNAENDRKLFLTLIKSHNVSVNAAKIAEHWPCDDPNKPTPKAITHRLAKIRGEIGTKTPDSKSTPRKPRGNATKATTPASKKRKVQNDNADESDADGHITEEESPTKRKSAQRGDARGGSMLGANATSPTRIKVENASNGFNDAQFNVYASEASELASEMQDAFGMNGDVSAGSRLGYLHEYGTNKYGTNEYGGIGNGHGNLQAYHSFVPGSAAIGDTPASAYSPTQQEPCPRSSRKASKRASEATASWLSAMKEQGKLDSERSSIEDSQASDEYMEDDQTFI